MRHVMIEKYSELRNIFLHFSHAKLARDRKRGRRLVMMLFTDVWF